MDGSPFYVVAGLFGALAIGALLLAISLSYRIERLKRPDLPRPRMVYTNIFASAFGSAPSEEVRKLRKQLRIWLLGALTCLLAIAASASLAPHEPTAEEQAAADALLAPQPAHWPGSILYYTRSNQDGSNPERILIHIVGPAEIAVAKMRDRCTSAALVTARFNPRTGEVVRLVGGRLQRDGTQLPEAFLTLDENARQLLIRTGDEKSAPVETIPAPPAPWRMYDFDFAEFALYGPRTPDAFSFGLALADPDARRGQPMVRVLGAADAQLFDTGNRIGAPYNHFALGGAAFGGDDGDGGGLLMIDAVFGHVIEARLGAPNHPGYDDLLIRLDAIDFGEELWREELLAHWRDCPA